MPAIRPWSLRLSLTVVAALLAAWLPAAESTTPAPAPATPKSPAVAEANVPNAGELQAALPKVASLVTKDEALFWQAGEVRFKVVAVEKNNPLVETAIGRLAVTRKLVADNRVDALAALPKLVEEAQKSGLKADGFSLAEGVMTGFHLRSPDVLVLVEGVARKSPLGAPERKAEAAGIAAAAKKLRGELEKSPLDDLGRKTVEDVLDRLSLGDNARKFEYDEVLPSFARRVVRYGWLAGLFKDTSLAATAAEIQKAVAAAEVLQPTTLYEGSGVRVAEVKNAFGVGGWTLVTPSHSAYTRPQPRPMYYWPGDPGINLVVELPAGADPIADANKFTGVRIFQGAIPLGSWSAAKGFAVDESAWRRAVPEKGPRIEEHIASNFVPPHILVCALGGDILRLITAHGVITPAANSDDAEAERFLLEAAKALPDAAHMDLIGEHLFYYVYDSPDSRYPYLIGNKQVKGDIHQTVYQTLDTVTGGMCRGDCDDLSEFYQEIAFRQHRTAHIISLPSHAALAFAEKQGDSWHVCILQTGQPLEFADAKLPDALKAAYTSFDEADTFDANGLGLLLRFSGENTRSGWRLSWRIFAEPEYAKTMIDVQKDWHFQTYQRGIAKMQKLIADGDLDTANYRELSGLYSFTGQYDLAAEYHQKALDATSDAESKLFSSGELLMHLFDAHQDAKARAAALDVLDKQLPPLQKGLGPKASQLGMELAGALTRGKAYDLAVRAIKETMLEEMTGNIDSVGQWLGSPQFNEKRWEQADQLRRQLQEYAGTAIALLKEAGPDALLGNPTLQTISRSAQDWLNNIAFHDTEEQEDVLMRYASAGHFYAAILGQDRLIKMLDEAKLPAKAEYQHTKRIGGLAQLVPDLAWIKLSVPFWFAVLEEQFEKERTTLDKPLVLKLGKQIAESYAACTKLGLETNFLDHEAHIAAVLTALVAEDEAALHERLHFVKEKKDKRLTDDTAQALGDPARFLSLDWYAKVLAIWKQEVNYKPKYYWIAWRAALNGGPQQALMVAKMAASEFKDDPAFTEEYEFMKKLFDKPAGAEKPKADAQRDNKKAEKGEKPVGAGK